MALVPITKDLDSRKIFEIMKLNIPVTIVFINPETGREEIDYRISIIERVYDKAKDMNLPKVTIGKSKNIFKHDYSSIVDLINIRLRENINYAILCEAKYLIIYKPLLDLLGKYSESLISTVTYIDYNKQDKYYEIRNIPVANGGSDVIYYFENNNSVLMFNAEGPKLFIPEVISNISDLLT